VQDLKHCVTFVTDELARMRGEDPVSVSLSDIMCALFDRVHPLAIGAIEQSYRLGRLITRRVLTTHLDEEQHKEKIDHIEQSLSDEYRSHHYAICRQEVKDDLGLNVTFPAPEAQAAIDALMDYYAAMLNAHYDVKADVPLPPIKNVGFIDSSTERRARRVALQLQAGTSTVIADFWVVPPEQARQKGEESQDATVANE